MDEVYAKYDAMVEMLGADGLLNAIMLAMSRDELDSYLDYIIKMYDCEKEVEEYLNL